MHTRCQYLISLSVCVCVTFVVFTDCESCERPISTNPGSMEAGEHGLTRGARFVAVCLEVVAVAGLMWVSWCVFGGAGFFLVFQVTTFSNWCIQSSQRPLGEGAPTASQSAHRELAPTYPHQVYRLVCSHLRNSSSMASSVDQYSSSARPKPVRSFSSFPTSFFQAPRAPFANARETEHLSLIHI